MTTEWRYHEKQNTRVCIIPDEVCLIACGDFGATRRPMCVLLALHRRWSVSKRPVMRVVEAARSLRDGLAFSTCAWCLTAVDWLGGRALRTNRCGRCRAGERGGGPCGVDDALPRYRRPQLDEQHELADRCAARVVVRRHHECGRSRHAGRARRQRAGGNDPVGPGQPGVPAKCCLSNTGGTRRRGSRSTTS